MNTLDVTIENLNSEHKALTEKLAQIDSDYRDARPGIVNGINQLAKALSALTGKPVAGASGNSGRKPMSEEGKAAIRAGLEKARAAKAGTVTIQQNKAAPAPGPAAVSADSAAKKVPTTDKATQRAN